MIKVFTPNEILQLVYEQDSNSEWNSPPEELSFQDEQGEVLYAQIKEVKDFLDAHLIDPSEKCIDKILLFSQSLK